MFTVLDDILIMVVKSSSRWCFHTLAAEYSNAVTHDTLDPHTKGIPFYLYLKGCGTESYPVRDSHSANESLQLSKGYDKL